MFDLEITSHVSENVSLFTNMTKRRGHVLIVLCKVQFNLSVKHADCGA